MIIFLIQLEHLIYDDTYLTISAIFEFLYQCRKWESHITQATWPIIISQCLQQNLKIS